MKVAKLGTTGLPIAVARAISEGLGVTISGTPSEGSVLVATSSTTAEWVLPGTSSSGQLLIADDHSTPLVFDDILQTDDGDDFLYAD